MPSARRDRGIIAYGRDDERHNKVKFRQTHRKGANDVVPTVPKAIAAAPKRGGSNRMKRAVSQATGTGSSGPCRLL